MAQRVRPTRRDWRRSLPTETRLNGCWAGAVFLRCKDFRQAEGRRASEGVRNVGPNSLRSTPMFIRRCIPALPMDGCWMSASILDTTRTG